jgi:hypothetical protein
MMSANNTLERWSGENLLPVKALSENLLRVIYKSHKNPQKRLSLGRTQFRSPGHGTELSTTEGL